MSPEPEPTSAVDLLDSLRQIIRMAARHAHGGAIREVGVTGPQLRILKELAIHQPSTVGRLVYALGVTNPTATGIIDRLVARGLVSRDRSATDRRRVLVTLTDAGRKVLDGAPRLPHERLVENCEKLSDAERARLLEALRKVTRMMASDDFDA